MTKTIVIACICALSLASAYVYFSSDSKPLTKQSSASLEANSIPEPAQQSVPSGESADGKLVSKSHVQKDDAGDVIVTDLPQVSEFLEEEYQRISNNPKYPSLASRTSAQNARRPESPLTPEQILNAMRQDEPWQTVAEPAASLPLTEEEINDGRLFIRYNPTKIETLMPGDSMKIRVDQLGQTFNMMVDKVKIYDDGNVTWRGSVNGTQNGAVSITQSENLMIASVTLDDSDYTLESRGSDGWIVDSAILFKIDPSVNDMVKFEDHEHH